MSALPAHLRARIVTADGSSPEATYDDLRQHAAALGLRLERGNPSRPRGQRSAYILWREGHPRRYATLADVEEALVDAEEARL